MTFNRFCTQEGICWGRPSFWYYVRVVRGIVVVKDENGDDKGLPLELWQALARDWRERARNHQE